MKRLGTFLRSLANRVDPPAPSYADFIEDLRREANQHPYGATSISEMVRECEAIKREIQAEYGTLRPNPQRPFTRPGDNAQEHESLASRVIRREIELERAKVVMPFVRKQIMRGER